MLIAIPRGEVLSYGEVAAEAGYPGVARAVGNLLQSTDLDLPWWRGDRRRASRARPREGAQCPPPSRGRGIAERQSARHARRRAAALTRVDPRDPLALPPFGEHIVGGGGVAACFASFRVDDLGKTARIRYKRWPATDAAMIVRISLDGTVNAGRKGIADLRDHYRPPVTADAVAPTEAADGRVLVGVSTPRR